MFKLRTMVTCILFLGSIGSSQATPLDSRDIVYIDGLPCNRACQSYMAWFGRVSKSRQAAPVSAQPLQLIEQSPKARAERKTKARQDRPTSAPPIRAAKKAVKPIGVPPPRTVDLRPAAGGEATSVPSERIAEAPPNSDPVSGSDAGTPPEQVAAAPASVDLTTVTAGPVLEQKAESTTESPAPADAIPPADAEMTALAPPDIADQSGAGTTPEQSATDSAAEAPATATGGPALDQKADRNTEAGPAEATPSADAETTTALASPNNEEQLVAILLVRPEINSVSDLANRVVAIDVSRSETVPSVRTAIVAAGAAGVRMSAGEALALTRVIDGDVSAAVVTLASPEEAEMWIAGIQDLKILRVPLSPPSEKARRG